MPTPMRRKEVRQSEEKRDNRQGCGRNIKLLIISDGISAICCNKPRFTFLLTAPHRFSVLLLLRLPLRVSV